MNGVWVQFFDRHGSLLMQYTLRGTFRGEMENTKQLLAADRGMQPEDIVVKIDGKEIAT